MRLHAVLLIAAFVFSACIRRTQVLEPDHGFLNSTRIVSFAVRPRQVAPGGTATISWKVERADRVVLEQVPPPGMLTEHSKSLLNMTVGPVGTLEIHPQDTTTYLLSCESELGNACASATVQVIVRGQ
jgi:hypothetical protein